MSLYPEAPAAFAVVCLQADSDPELEPKGGSALGVLRQAEASRHAHASVCRQRRKGAPVSPA